MKVQRHIFKLWQKLSPATKHRLALIVASLVILNGIVVFLALFAGRQLSIMVGLITIAYGLGLRHAVDADHIAAIDNTTRKLIQEGKKPVAVGFFFSLGHSTIVILLSLMIGLSASFVQRNLPTFQHSASIIGTFISSFFLLLIGTINLITLIDIIKVWRKVTKGKSLSNETINEHLDNKGFLARLLKGVLKSVSNSWNMYPIGILFGLGFDTASEVALLSLSALAGSRNMTVANIMALPLAFTAGMCLIDTLDGILMLGAYGWANVKPIRKLYYNMNLTFISVFIALFIGGIEALQALSQEMGWNKGIFKLANALQFDNLGYIIIAVFAASWVISIFIYKVRRYDLIKSH